MDTFSDKLMASLARLVAGEQVPMREFESLLNCHLIHTDTYVSVDDMTQLGGGELTKSTQVEITYEGRQHLDAYLKKRGAL